MCLRICLQAEALVFFSVQGAARVAEKYPAKGRYN